MEGGFWILHPKVLKYLWTISIIMSVTIPGAVSLAVKFKDGVIIGNDNRMTMNYLVLSKTTKKVFTLTDDGRIAISASGLLGDLQYLVRLMRAQANLYELRENHKISVKAMAKMVANFLYSRKMAPIYTNVEIAGVDEDGTPSMYSMDAIGSLMPDNFSCSGTGSTFAYGLLEAEYNPNMTVKDGIEFMKKVIKNAVKRDALTGNGFDLIVISKNETKELSFTIDELGE